MHSKSEKPIIEQVATEGAITQSEAARRYGQHPLTVGSILDAWKKELESKFPDLAERNVSTSGLWRFMTERISFTLKLTKAVEERRNTSETIQQKVNKCGCQCYQKTVNMSILAAISFHGVEDVSVKLAKGFTTGEGACSKRALQKLKSSHVLAASLLDFSQSYRKMLLQAENFVKRKSHLKGCSKNLIEHIKQSTFELTQEYFNGWIDHSINFSHDFT
ncbi:hypothetical protein [Parasitella parasitica]|uniref:HTH psq-type domain-containing protein n=1 Tax=Parasitella parasitica TaxID=35722 RepID=A0A0B7N6A5_9FUNG|nr:hypothetical protein [Parasitella parasitica]